MTGRWGRPGCALSKPVIAAVEGHAVAGGLELAIWADLRVAARDAVFGVFCRRWGVPLVDGGTVRLPRLVGQSRALDLILTGRAGRRPRRRSRSGLVNRVVEHGHALAGAVRWPRSWRRCRRRACGTTGSARCEQWALPEREAMANELRHGQVSLSRRVAGRARSGSPRARAATAPERCRSGCRGTRCEGTQRRGAGFLHPCCRRSCSALTPIALLRDRPVKQQLHLGLEVATMSPQRADGSQLPRLCPSRHCLRVYPKKCRHFGRV